MRQCDLVPPLRGALQNFSIILAAEETGRPKKVRTFNDTLELDGPPGKQTGHLLEGPRRPRIKISSALPVETFWPVDIADGSRSLEHVLKTRTMASHENSPTI